MPSKARQFAIEIDRELNLNRDELRLVIRKVALEALSRIVLRTPVDTGRARGNWFVQVGGAGFDLQTEIKDKEGDVTVSNGALVIGNYKHESGFPVISIYNNLPYINRLENGSSKQTNNQPGGIVAITATELRLEPL